jgi:hypothetical protein
VDVSRADVVGVIDQLLSGDLSREEASAWAAARHIERSPDLAVEEALDVLTLVDARHSPEQGDYLYDLSEVSIARKALRP